MGSVCPRGELPGASASTTWSKSLDLPEPLGPTSTTLRIRVVSGTVGAWVGVPVMAPNQPLSGRAHKRDVTVGW